MFKKLTSLLTVCVLIGIILLTSGTARANWLETFDDNSFDLATWLFRGYPEITGTLSATIQDGPDDDDYLAFDETSSADVGGTQLGVGIGDPDDIFSDVRVTAVFNVSGDASRTYHGLAARINYFIDDGSMSGYPGMIANTYLMMIHYEEGPANLKIELLKIVNNDVTIMATYEPEVLVPGLDHAKGHYVELDVVGSDPVYITGSIYDHKGGPLLVRTPTFIDTSANDPWEAPGIHDDVFASGVSGITASNQDLGVVGYHSPYDSVSSISDGPAAVNPSPADGTTDVPIDTALSWIEAEFATGRELWIGKAGAMEKVDPAPTGTTYTPGNLELGETYEWRIDQVGATGTVTGHTWTFTVADYLIVDDFESYTNHEDIRIAWVDNIDEAGLEYVLLAAGANNAMRFEFSNQFDPYFTENTRTFVDSQDWTVQGVEELSLSFIGDDEHENFEHLLYLTLEDAAGQSFRVETYPHAVQTYTWRQWIIALNLFSDAGVDLTSVKKITIGTGDGTDSGQSPEGLEPDRDYIHIDQIILHSAG